MDLIQDLYARHDVVHLLFSGGKDSTLCLEYVLEYGFGDRTVLVVIDTQDLPQEISSFIKTYESKVRRIDYVKSNSRAWIQRNGFPTDVMVVDNTLMGRLYKKDRDGVMMCSRQDCCQANVWGPMAQYLSNPEVTAVIMGEKDSDSHGSYPYQWTLGDHVVEVCRPIARKSSNEVRQELKVRGKLLKRFMGNASSLDCLHCTAYWETFDERMDYLYETYPQTVTKLRGVVSSMQDTIKKAMSTLK